ncbi:MAG TPA: YetF domain-containing protein [Gaiellaceae bacterium]|jgi:uncharacterized membrane protein YcaP (DUF421 family)|nr:YetF domain-containing protein [Gaiellaceae bacterium]
MDIALRAIVAYVFIVFMLRVVGRRELSNMTPTDLVLLVIIGDLVQSGVTQSDMSVTGITIAVSTIALLSVGSSYLSFKSRRVERVLEGVPLILVEGGKPIEHNLRSQRMTIGDLMEEARGQGIERLEQVKWAVLERSGSVSFIKR